MQLPRDWHGFWVKLEGTTRYGKICKRFCPNHYNHSVEWGTWAWAGSADGKILYHDCDCEPMFWVMWYNSDVSRAKYTHSASCEPGCKLRLLPVEPEPWYH